MADAGLKNISLPLEEQEGKKDELNIPNRNSDLPESIDCAILPDESLEIKELDNGAKEEGEPLKKKGRSSTLRKMKTPKKQKTPTIPTRRSLRRSTVLSSEASIAQSNLKEDGKGGDKIHQKKDENEVINNKMQDMAEIDDPKVEDENGKEKENQEDNSILAAPMEKSKTEEPDKNQPTVEAEA